MGGTSKEQNTQTSQQQSGTGTQNTSSQLQPWMQTSGLLNNLLGQVGNVGTGQTENSLDALRQLGDLGVQGNQFAGQIGGVANNLLAGGGANNQAGMFNDAYKTYQDQIGATARGDYTDPNTNPFFAQTTQTIGNDVQNRLAGLYAGSGRDPSGAGSFAPGLARGVAEGTAPIYSNIYEQERQNQLGAAGSLYGAGNTTASNLTNLQQMFNQNQQAGIGAADAANAAQQYGPMLRLQAEAQKTGIPLQTLAQQLGIVAPITQAFGQQAGQGTQSTNMTGSGTQNTQQVTPFNPWSLAPLALMPLTGGASGAAGGLGSSLLGMGASKLFGGASNGFMGPGSFNSGG